jgi:2,5-diamino-6-(ribosylamino)-4(3H)-pyrimidinone 5'-phosphate reductase
MLDHRLGELAGERLGTLEELLDRPPGHLVLVEGEDGVSSLFGSAHAQAPSWQGRPRIGPKIAEMSRPRVILHSAVSIDGRIDGFEPDVGTYYELIATWKEDATLCGSGTILAAAPAPDSADDLPIPEAEPDDGRPVLAVVDSRGTVRSWRRLLAAGHWRAGIAFCSAATPARHLEYLRDANVEPVTAGVDRVDLGAALNSLAERGAGIVRIDAGPTLNGIALRGDLVDELSLLVHPVISGQGRFFADQIDDPLELRPVDAERRGTLLWLRFSPG